MRVLVVEDDRSLATVLQRGLTEEGYGVELCHNGAEALRLARTWEYDALILDIMLPGKDGLAVCRELRQLGVGTPILMLTARDGVDDTVHGLEAGADDYVRKPFAFRELRARLHTVIHRHAGATSSELRSEDVVLDIARREVRRAGKNIALTNREFQVLAYLMQNPGRILTRLMIEDFVWGHSYPGLSNTVDVHIKRLRQKLDRPGELSLIDTVRGAGYRFRLPTP